MITATRPIKKYHRLNILIFVWLIFSFAFVQSTGRSGKRSPNRRRRVNSNTISPSSLKRTNTPAPPSVPKASSKSPNNTTNTTNASFISNTGVLDFHTKIILVVLSAFMLIFMLILLVIGHFTWFAQVRKNLQEEWEEELRAAEMKRERQEILSEMRDPFQVESHHRDSVDSNGCSGLGLCVPPHHSILCPNNPNVPSLHEPCSSFIHHHSEDPNSSSSISGSYWLNLDSCVVRQPVPINNTFKPSHSHNFLPRQIITPVSPTPITTTIDISSISMPNLNLALKRDVESELVLKNDSDSKFDISKLDMF